MSSGWYQNIPVVSRLFGWEAPVKEKEANGAAAATASPSSSSSPSPYPDYMLDPDAVAKDKARWRHGGPPDYRVTRQMYANERRATHKEGSLERMVENLIKNWEVEASHKLHVSEWRTVAPNDYKFSCNGGPFQDGEHMLKVGTYSAVISANKYYGPQFSEFEESHNTFRAMMPNFAFEVLEVYSGPPVVACKWRHWGWMKGDYVGKNEDGDTVTIKAHGETLDIQGITIAKVNEKLQITSLETYFDGKDMFEQMKPSKDTMKVVKMKCPMGFSADVNGFEDQKVG